MNSNEKQKGQDDTNQTDNSKIIEDQTTHPTSADTRAILRDLLYSLEKVDFRILKHPRRDQILKRINQFDKSSSTTENNKEKSEQKNEDSAYRQNLESMLESVRLNERDYKVLAIEQIVQQGKKLGNPLSFYKEATYIYNSKFWDTYERNDFEKFLEHCYLRLGVPMTMAKDATFIKKGFDQFQKAAHIRVDDNQEHETLLNFQNGTMEFKENGKYKIRGHAKEDFLTYVLPFQYDEDAVCPKFQKYLDEVVPEKDKQQVLAEFIGSVFSQLKHEKVLILFGSGNNGKSVFLDIITALLGSENVSCCTLEELTKAKGYYRGDIRDKLLNFSGEISTKVNPDKFKTLASGEKIKGRYPYGDPFEMENYARLAFNCNKLPDVTEKTDGFFRRFKIVPFEVKITEKQKDRDLAKKIIAEELPGIMNWVLDGLQRMEENKKLSICESGERLLEQYRQESDTVGQFLEDNRGQFKEPVQASALYDRYEKYCYRYSYGKLGPKQFAQELVGKGINKYRRSEGFYYDVHEDQP